MSKMKNLPVNEEQLAALFRQAVERVSMDEDPLELNEYRAIFKKNVPLHLRSYVAGYIASKMVGSNVNLSSGNHGKKKFQENRGKNNVKNEKPAAVEAEPQAKQPRVVIPAGEGKTIYIGMGRNRHVFPKDLVGMITQVCNVSRDRIGSINVHEAFSFVELYKSDADNVISSLNGYEYRGKKLNVSYAKKNDEAAKASDVPAEQETLV